MTEPEKPAAEVPRSRPAAVPAAALRRLTRLIEQGFVARAPLTLQLLSRLLVHAIAVGAAVGVVSLIFVKGLEVTEHFVLEGLCGYVPLRAAGEIEPFGRTHTPFRPWLLLIIPGIGALLGGLFSTLAPETRGGGADAIIESFHYHGGAVRRRVPWVKVLASIATLGFGGSGGREGPTMQIGGAIGSSVGRYFGVTDRERRILLVAGTGAGMAAVFRTPLGAALLAVEIMHRDDFESDALVPAVIACVVSYSTFITFFGEGTLFAHAPKYPFIPAHLPLYALMALVVAGTAALFVNALDRVHKFTEKLRTPHWVKPAIGGLALGIFVTPIVWLLGSHMGSGQGLGILGGGYGSAQVAITGAAWFPRGWFGVEVLLLLGMVKLLGTSLTVGTGGSAGDFGPSMVMGAIFGGAFGRAAQMLLHDPSIDPGAFALVGMATFYGGLAHIPIASLVMTCELAGSYDLLVPLMLAEGIAYVVLRNATLYSAQVVSKRESPAHRDDFIIDFLKGIRVDQILVRDRPFVTFQRKTVGAEVIQKVAASEWQDTFPVLADDGKLCGVIIADILRATAMDPDFGRVALADDMMAAPVSVRETDDLHKALEVLLANAMREVIVTDESGKVVGFVDQTEITAAYLAATNEQTSQTTQSSGSSPSHH